MKNIIFIISAIVVILDYTKVASADELPDFGDSAGSVISPDFERRLGKSIMRKVYQDPSVIRDPEVQSYIQSIGYRLVSNSDDNQLPFTFFIINSPQINAFAAPGGVVGINSAVLINSRTESELASVLAHEISHVTQRHLARSFEKASQMSMPMAAAMLGSILLAIASPDAGMAALVATQGMGIQSQINFTRANEEEADRVGMQLLVRSGFDPYGMPGFFELLQNATKYYGKPPEFLSTHPLTDSRIADTISRAEQYPKKEYQDSVNFSLIRTKLIVYGHENSKEAVKYFEKNLSIAKEKDRIPLTYGYALALTADNRYEQARQQIKTLLNEDKNNTAYLLAAANLESSQNNYATALGLFKEAHRLYPDYRPVVMGYAKTLLDAKKPSDARDLLRNYSRYHEPDIDYYKLLAQAEAQTGHPAEAEIANAEFHYLSGDTRLAIDRLKYAQQKLQLDFYQRERMSARQAQLEYEYELEQEIKL